jgi:L-galactose dehydrogenase
MPSIVMPPASTKFSPMQYRTLGRTGLRVSVMGMGTGGLDPLGEKSGRTPSEMISLLRRAFDLGINLFDTSPNYGTNGRSEKILGQALQSLPRDRIVVSTKIPLAASHSEKVTVMRAREVAAAVEASLLRLGLNEIDVLLVAVASPQYLRPVLDELMPPLQKLKTDGKVRYLGSSEQTRSDGSHEWLQVAMRTGLFDVVMVGHNMLNQSAQDLLFPYCREQNIGVLNVFTVRNLFWNLPRLKEVLSDFQRRRLLPAEYTDAESGSLDWLLDGDVESLVEAAYRYVAYTDGVTTVMCGTTKESKLEENIKYVLKGPIADDKLLRLRKQFGRLAEPVGN